MRRGRRRRRVPVLVAVVKQTPRPRRSGRARESAAERARRRRPFARVLKDTSARGEALSAARLASRDAPERGALDVPQQAEGVLADALQHALRGPGETGGDGAGDGAKRRQSLLHVETSRVERARRALAARQRRRAHEHRHHVAEQRAVAQRVAQQVSLFLTREHAQTQTRKPRANLLVALGGRRRRGKRPFAVLKHHRDGAGERGGFCGATRQRRHTRMLRLFRFRLFRSRLDVERIRALSLGRGGRKRESAARRPVFRRRRVARGRGCRPRSSARHRVAVARERPRAAPRVLVGRDVAGGDKVRTRGVRRSGASLRVA